MIRFRLLSVSASFLSVALIGGMINSQVLAQQVIDSSASSLEIDELDQEAINRLEDEIMEFLKVGNSDAAIEKLLIIYAWEEQNLGPQHPNLLRELLAICVPQKDHQ